MEMETGTSASMNMMASMGMGAWTEADMRRRFWIALVLTIPLIVMSGAIPGIPALIRPPASNWVALVLATPVVWWCGWIFLSDALTNLRTGNLGMPVLVSTGVLTAYLSSLYLTIIGYGVTYYDASAMLVTFVLFGQWMLMKSQRGTTNALNALLALAPPTARLLRGGEETTVLTSEVVAGDLLRVRPGEKVPVDGELIEGDTDVDESLITGESRPVHKVPGDALIGGSLDTSAAVTMRATRVGSDTVLARITALVERAQNSKSPRQRLADKAASVLVVVAIGAGIVTFAAWTISGAAFLTALTFATSAVVIACPDALGLATPTAVAVGIGLGAKHNILIKDADTLEGVSRIDTVVFDKTGTLTEGQPSVTDIAPEPGVSEEDLLRTAGAAAAESTHPLSIAIARAATQKGWLREGNRAAMQNVPGLGLLGSLNGAAVTLGNLALLERERIEVGSLRAAGQKLGAQGRSVTYVALGGQPLGAIGITDAVRATSAAAVRDLASLGVASVLLSGDTTATAERVAKEVGISRVFAEVRPEQKADYIQRLQREGQATAMVGDGVNDAPALAQADIGIAIGAGTDVAIQSAGVVLMKSDPVDVAQALRLSRATVRKMKENLAWATVYNAVAIPVAAGVFFHSLGWVLPPQASALLMSASSIAVAVNAVSLRFARI